MARVDEISGARTPLAADLALSTNAISYNQEIAFQLYVRRVLPLDGYVFWVNANLVDASTLPENLPIQLVAQGSLHYATDSLQEEEESYAVNRVVFTSLGPVDNLNQRDPGYCYIATFEWVRFSFSQRGGFYRQATLYHYSGDAIYADAETQVIDDPTKLDPEAVIVSNSLPAWLALNGYAPQLPSYGFGNTTPLFPSFLLPDNLRPPFISVHIEPDGTEALAATPLLGRRSSHYQLMRDRVRLTLWGLNNAQALDFMDCVYQWMCDYGVLGLMNFPALRDEKRTQRELSVISQKKTVTFEVSYLQSTVRDVARQLISSATVNVVLPGSKILVSGARVQTGGSAQLSVGPT